MYICKYCGAHLDAGEKCDCQEQEQEREESEEDKTFLIRATRCRRCHGILTSDYGIKYGIGQCCRQKEMSERPLSNQISLFE